MSKSDVTPQQQTANYYGKLGSRLGYRLVMRRSQHFGYYDQNHTTEPAAQDKYHQEFARLLDLKPGMKVFDAGCGQGVVACYLAGHFDVKTTGVTVTPHEIVSANKRAKRLKVNQNTTFMLADYAKTGLPDNSFDRVYTTESLSDAPDVQKVVRELYRVLKPGGALVCAEYEMDHPNFSERTRHLANLIKKQAAIHGMYQFGKGQFESNLEKTGFELEQVVDWTPHVKPSFDRLRRLAKPFARVVRGFNIEHKYVNVTAAALYADGVEEGIFAYKVYCARKRN